MNMRKKRLAQWGAAIMLVTVLFVLDKVITDQYFTERNPVTVYAPEDMKSAFKSAVKSANLASENEIVITNNATEADVIIGYGKENDAEYTKIAFSPFVIGYNKKDTYFKQLWKAGILIPNEYDEGFFEIDFLKVVNEAIGSGQWKNLGVKDQGTITIFYPDKDTPYWHDFYNFMLLTINGGTYPETSTEMNKAVEVMEKFENSSFTESIKNFDEQIVRTSGFGSNILYVLPEKVLFDLALDNEQTTRVFFPLKTSYFNYFVKGNSDIGKKVVDNFKDDSYSSLRNNDYRNSSEYELNNSYSCVLDERDIFKAVEIPKSNFFTSNYFKETK